MSEETKTGTSKVRWRRVVLAVSLALNLAVAGMVLGAVLRQDDKGRAVRSNDKSPVVAQGEHFDGLRNRDMGFMPFIDAVDQEHRRDLAVEFMRSAGDRKEARERLRTYFEAVVETLRTEPFNEASFANLVSEHQRELAAQQEVGMQVLARHIAEMSDEERAAYAERLERILNRPPRRQ